MYIVCKILHVKRREIPFFFMYKKYCIMYSILNEIGTANKVPNLKNIFLMSKKKSKIIH